VGRLNSGARHGALLGRGNLRGREGWAGGRDAAAVTRAYNHRR
jgi:hypothetical protein